VTDPNNSYDIYNTPTVVNSNSVNLQWIKWYYCFRWVQCAEISIFPNLMTYLRLQFLIPLFSHLSCRTGIFKTPCSRMDNKLVEAIPVQALRIPGGWGFQFSRQSGHDDKVVSPTHWLPLPSRKYSWYSFLLEVGLTPEPQCGHGNGYWIGNYVKGAGVT
jgi:hypothetical protein